MPPASPCWACGGPLLWSLVYIALLLGLLESRLPGGELRLASRTGQGAVRRCKAPEVAPICRAAADLLPAPSLAAVCGRAALSSTERRLAIARAHALHSWWW